MHVFVLMVTGRFSHRVYVAYTTVSHMMSYDVTIASMIT